LTFETSFRLPENKTGSEYQGIMAAVDLALQRAELQFIGTGFKFEIQRYDDKCEPDIVLKSFIQLYNMRNKLIGVIGPGKLKFLQIVTK
jgi:hypothetical protein